MNRPRIVPAFVALTVALAACGHQEFEPPDRTERLEHAALAYSPALFDSIQWGSHDDWDDLGNAIYIDLCRKCHGPLGQGDTPYARQRGLTVPSLVKREWSLASMDSLHRVIYVGHEEGMPIYGDGGISLRQIDAVAHYILEVLRPDVALEGEG